MPRDEVVFLQDMLSAVTKIEAYSEGFSPNSLDDGKTRDAILRNLEVLGEAAKSVTEKIRAQEPQIEWRKIAGLRDVLIHQYFGVDNEILKDIITTKLPPMKAALSELVAKLTDL